MPGLETVVMLVAARLALRHPLAQAVLAGGRGGGLTAQDVDEFEQIPGGGLGGLMSGTPVAAGNARLMETLGLEVAQALSALALAEASQGATPLFHCFGRERYRHHRRRRRVRPDVGPPSRLCADAASGS